MDYSTPGFPVHHQLPQFAQTHVHRAGDAFQLLILCRSLLLPLIVGVILAKEGWEQWRGGEAQAY